MTTATWQELGTGSRSIYKPPAPVRLALRLGLEGNAVRLAAMWSQRDVTTLTNLIFFHCHPERGGRKLARDERNYLQLSREWLSIRDTVVLPALKQRRSASVAAGECRDMIIDYHSHAGNGDVLPGLWDSAAPLERYFGADLPSRNLLSRMPSAAPYVEFTRE